MLLERRAANYCLPDLTNLERYILLSKFSQVIIDVRKINDKYIFVFPRYNRIKIEMDQSGFTAGVNTNKGSSLMKNVKTGKLFRRYNWFQYLRLNECLAKLVGNFCWILCYHQQGFTINNFVPTLCSEQVSTHGPFPSTNAIDCNIFHSANILIIFFTDVILYCNDDMLV